LGGLINNAANFKGPHSMTYQSINPNNGKLLQSFEYMSSDELENSLATAQTCFQTWRHKSYAERAVIINKAASLLRAHVDDFAQLETLEMGKRIAEARGEVEFSADILAYYAEHAEAFLAPTKLHPKIGEAHMES
jgi:succinate-semialdehyde dehydrogenase/glutarate-semialdehyde dehydrogenase